MEPLEASTHSFILKVWRERTGRSCRPYIWRGQITHVGGERRLIGGFSDLIVFVGSYLREMGVYPGWWYWALRLLLPLRRRRPRHRPDQ